MKSLSELSPSKIESLTVVMSGFAEAKVDELRSLKRMSLVRCSGLSRLQARKSSIREIEVVSCKSFDVGSLAQLNELVKLSVGQRTRPIDLAKLGSLKKLADITLTNTVVKASSKLKGHFPSLRRLWISPMKNELLQATSVLLRRAMVCNGKELYLKGARQPSVSAFFDEQ
jgi:hypothetical protein